MPFPDFYPAEKINKGPAHYRKNTRDQNINNYMFLKYHNTAKKSKIPKKIRMFLSVVFITEVFYIQT